MRLQLRALAYLGATVVLFSTSAASAQTPPSVKTKKQAPSKATAPAKAPAAAPAPAASTPGLGLDLNEPPPAPAAAPAPAPVEEKKPEVRTLEAYGPNGEPTDPSATAKAEAATQGDGRLGLFVGAKAALVIPSGRTTDVQANVAEVSKSVSDASHSATGAFALAVGYAPPFLDRALSIRGEAGIYPLSGTGKRSYPNDPDFGEMSYSYSARGIPLCVGLGYRLPLPIPVDVAPQGGFAAVHTTMTSTWTRDGVSTETAPTAGWALGFYAGVEASYKLGPGALTGEVRYMNARTDLRMRDVPEYGGAFNKELGDVQGTNVLLGYRFDL